MPPRSPRASSTRERVLQSTDRLWSERGVRGASLEDIAREASVTKPTVYYYFADKGTLLTAVICSVLEQHGGGLRPAARRGARARDRLASAVAYPVGAKSNGPRPAPAGGPLLARD